MPDLAAMVSLDVRSLVSLRVVLPTYALLVVAYTVAWGPQMALPLFGVAALIVGNTLFGLGESSRLNLLYGTLPVRRRTVVLAHYLVSAVALTALVSLGALFGTLANALRGTPDAELPLTAAATLGVTFVAMAFQQPAIVRWGARGAAFGLLFVALAASMLMLTVTPWLLPADALGATLASASTQAWLPWGIVAAGAGALAASYPIAVRIDERQDH